MWIPKVRAVLSIIVMVLGVIVTIGIPFFNLLGSRVRPHIGTWSDAIVRDLMQNQPTGMQLVLALVVPLILVPLVPLFVIAAFWIELWSLDSLCLVVVLGCVHYAGFKLFTWWYDAMVGIGVTYILACLFAR